MELRNPLSKYQLDVLRPFPLVVDFDWSDVAGGDVVVGKLLEGHIVEHAVVRITSPFDGGTQITVGDAVAQGRLQVISDNDPLTAGEYRTSPNYEYLVDTEIKVFFSAGSPTTGAGKVIIYG